MHVCLYNNMVPSIQSVKCKMSGVLPNLTPAKVILIAQNLMLSGKGLSHITRWQILASYKLVSSYLLPVSLGQYQSAVLLSVKISAHTNTVRIITNSTHLLRVD